jgi:FkbM family methyltransferase
MKDTLKKLAPADSSVGKFLRFFLVRLPTVVRSRIDKKRSERELNRFCENTKSVFFVQIGANDGATYDPVFERVRKFGWQGLLVEPIPDVFKKLVENYSAHPGLIFENCAVSDQEELRNFYTIPGHSKLSSFLPEVVEKATQWLGLPKEVIQNFKVQCLPPSRLFEKHRISRIDLLLIDTEGFDYEILKRIDLNRFQPQIIMYEEAHLQPKDRKACRSMLQNNGYRLFCYWGDVMGVKLQ